MNNTILKQNQLKSFEPALRHILSLNSNEIINFNHSKKRNNALADIIYFKDTIGHFIKVFPSFSQYEYTVPVEKYLLIQNANDLEYIMLIMSNGFALVKKQDFLKLPYETKVTNNIKQLHFRLLDDQMNSTFGNDSYIFNQDSKTLVHNGTIADITKYYTDLTLKAAFLMPDHKLGKLYTFAFVDTDGSIMGWNQKDISDYVESVYGKSTDDNAKAKGAFNKKIRRYIKKVEATYEKGEKLEPLVDVANSKDINVYIFPLGMFQNTKADFLQYQNTHEAHKKKTENMKEYQKEYQKSEKYKDYKRNYDRKHNELISNDVPSYNTVEGTVGMDAFEALCKITPVKKTKIDVKKHKELPLHSRFINQNIQDIDIKKFGLGKDYNYKETSTGAFEALCNKTGE